MLAIYASLEMISPAAGKVARFFQKRRLMTLAAPAPLSAAAPAKDLIEPLHAKADVEAGTFAHRSRYVAPYVRIKARRIAVAARETPKTLWTP